MNNVSTGYHAGAAASQAEQAAKDRRAREQEAAQEAAHAREAAQARQRIEAEQAAQFEARARAVPSELFDADPEIEALRDDYAVKQRQRPILSLANPEFLRQESVKLSERVKAGTLEAMIAATEDAMTGDPSLQRAMVVQRRVDEDVRRLALLTATMERLSRFGFSQLAREREQAAGQALEAALMNRKRQYLREQPPTVGASDPSPGSRVATVAGSQSVERDAGSEKPATTDAIEL